MKKLKNTKISLLISVFGLAICLSLLVGTTFAWFNDSAQSTRNVIQAGTLDVELEYSTDKGKSWHSIDGASNIFGGSFWEPGCVHVVWFKVKNCGSLALKYKMNANIYAEREGISILGNRFNLSNYIYSEVVPTTATRNDILAITNANTLAEGLLHEKDSFKLEPHTDSEPFALAIWMPVTVGNEANHDGVHLPSLDLGIELHATQANIESDSFGPDYDIDAEYND